MKQPFAKRPHRSLVEQIQEAETREQIDLLLAEGTAFADASPETVGRWRRTAKKRRKELSR